MKKDLYLVVDIGGTKILVVLFNDAGNIVERRKLRTPDKSRPEELVNLIFETLIALEQESEAVVIENIVAAGICFAGFVEHQKRLVHQAPNLGWQEPVALVALFEAKLKKPVIIENDASAAVVGEVYYGAARGHQDVIYITFSTGIGGGLFLGGKLYRGSCGFAGEIGHTKSFGKGRSCNCGGENCLEAWASGSGIDKSATALWEPTDLNVEKLTTAIVFAEAAAGNQPAELIVQQAIHSLGIGLANLVNILNPTCLVIGGGIINAHPNIIAQLDQVVRHNAIRPAAQISEIQMVQAVLGEDSGLWGIYALLRAKD